MAMISHESLKKTLKNRGLVVDIRSYHEYLIDMIPGAIHISELLINFDKYRHYNSVIIYCETANRSGKTHNFL